MGCCQSATATRPGAAAAQGADAPNLTEVPAHERSIGELKRIFEGVNANEEGHANKAELAASLEKERNLDALLKEAEMNEIMDVVNRITRHDGEFVSWEEFMQFTRVAEAEVVAEGVKETVVHAVEHKIEQLQEWWQGAEKPQEEVQEVAEQPLDEVEDATAELKEEAQHEAEEFKKEVAADVACSEKEIEEVDVLIEEAAVTQRRCLGCC